MTTVRTIHTVRNMLTRVSVVITSKLTSKAQTTIPQPAQQVRDGDDPCRTFGEWDSLADRKAYGGL